MGLFKSLKKEEKMRSVQSYFPFLIVGRDFVAAKLLVDIISEHGEDAVRLLAQREIKSNDLLYMGPPLLRGAANQEIFKQLCPEIPLYEAGGDEISRFYKEQAFRPFDGRMKPSNELLFKEDFFVLERALFDQEKLLANPVEQEIRRMKDYAINGEIRSIGREDRHGKQVWRIELKTGDVVACETLFYGENPHWFYRQLSDKTLFSDHFYEFCQKIKNQFSLIYQGTIHGPEVTKERGTIFLPQNLSAENGHFIGEFFPYDDANKTQNFTFFCFLDESEEDAELISRKIKLLKRTLKRVFPLFAEDKVEENISITDQTPNPEIDDHLYQKLSDDLSSICFFGSKAPIVENMDNYESSKISNIARSLVTYKHAKSICLKAS